nr:MAG TPA: hypothetical protein [Caudoviricetes sp.]DAY36857.1 MAG TPA: hypothetical protein [Caudoviricetes sp.]
MGSPAPQKRLGLSFFCRFLSEFRGLKGLSKMTNLSNLFKWVHVTHLKIAIFAKNCVSVLTNLSFLKL